MKFLNKISALLIIVLLMLSVALYSVNKGDFFKFDNSKKIVLTENSPEKSSVKENSEAVDDRSKTVFNYNFLFNLLSKFTFKELNR